MPLIKPSTLTGEWLVNEPSQLDELSPLPGKHVAGRGMIRLSNGMKDHPERQHFEFLLNRYYYACGCGEGSLGMMIGLGLSAIWTAYPFILGLPPHKNLILTLVIVAAVSAIAGKIVGLFYGHWKLKQITREIQGEWPSQPASAN